MDLSALQALLERAPGLTLACVGDIMLDRYVYGEVSRISPEAPVPVLRAVRESAMLGAVGNVARNVAALGAKVSLAAAVGNDAGGAEINALLKAESALFGHLDWIDGGVTTCKTRFLSGGQQLLRLDREGGDPPLVRDPESFVLRVALSGAQVVLVSDYAKGYVDAGVLREIAATGLMVVVDPKGADFARYGDVDLLKPNAGELAAATGLPVGDDAEVEAALARGLALWPAKAILVTRGAQGASLAQRGRPVLHVRARARAVFDVSGAGDTSLAALGLALAAGASLDEAAAFAVLASGVAVSKPGTAVVTPSELIAAEMAAHGAPLEAKITSARQAADVAAAWRAQGLRVGFTNGCFDVLHRGHVDYLTQARSWCDRLIVALNTDGSVRALKGEGRPVNDLESRSAVIAGLASVDLVTAFDAPTPLALIEAVRPDVLVKGADYTVETVVGADLVQGWGGEVRLATFTPGFSTTATLKRAGTAA
jgi:D-beta-D-heptose 7-phosphate kinase/D-beta-D-heptose 1-phosphate adenosyltransferase